MTVSGTVVSLAAGESDVVVGTSTETLAPYISAGFGAGPNGTTAQKLTGGAEGMSGWRWREVGLAGLVWWGVSRVVVMG